jgi:N-acetyl-alpha-D-muramate 1-phosphate uridylyltransferase
VSFRVSADVPRAMVLAAGRGERMRPLTDTVPKALLMVRGKPLIAHHVEKLARLGVQEVVINLAWLGAQIRQALGDGSRWNLGIHYSDEGSEALETGGGILRALPWLGPAPFLVVNGDVFTEFDFGQLTIAPHSLAQLLLVPNPDHNPQGDFALSDTRLTEQGVRAWTYAGIGLFRPELFAGCTPGRFPLLPLLYRASALGRLHGQPYRGPWTDVGSPERLAALQ